jgi:TonB-dependent receptor
MDLEVYDNMIARFSYSRSIARPPIGSLLANRSFPGNPNVRSRLVERGNPELLPYVSDNVDLSFEWYYGDGSYASIGHFRKRVDNFLVTSFEETTYPDLGLTDPYIGALAEAARADLTANGEPLDDPSVLRRANELRGTPVTDPIDGAPGDPLAVYTVSTVANEQVGNLFGWELAVQHMFADTGFGVQANLTIVNGDVDADRDVINQSFALPGLSDTANISVFYENDVVSARLAFNWRDEFLAGFDEFGSPIFNEEYTPMDLNVTWYAMDNLDVFFQAINITDEVQRTYIRYPEQLQRANEYGSRFNIGARYNF